MHGHREQQRDLATEVGAAGSPDLPADLPNLDPYRVTWQWSDGGGGYVDCVTSESAQLVVADLRPDSRVWIGHKLVREGWTSV